MIQSPQTWCQIETFALKNKLVLQKVFSLFCSKVTMIFVVTYATIVSRPCTILKESLFFNTFNFLIKDLQQIQVLKVCRTPGPTAC